MGLLPIAVATIAAGQVYSGMAASAEGKGESRLAKYNAQVQEREAQAIEQRGKREGIMQAKEAERRMSTLAARLGTSGVVTTEGSPLAILAEQATESEQDNLMIGYNAQLEASRARAQARADIYEGKLAKQRGRNKATASYIGAGGTLLTGFSSDNKSTTT